MGQRRHRSSRRTLLGGSLAVALLVIVPSVALGVRGDFFQPPTSPESAGPAPLSVTAANFNGDAFTDLAVTDTDDNYDAVDILLGSASGNFTAAAGSPEAVGSSSTWSAAANFDADADVDLAVANLSTNDVTILLNDGSGNFSEADTSPELVGMAPIAIAAANFDGDGDTDLAVVTNDDTDVSILLNNGAADFTPTVVAGVELNPRAIVAANLGGTAATDLAVANRDSDDVTILLGDGAGNFSEPPGSPEGAGNGPQGIAAGSFGGSAHTDLAVANRESDNVSILIGSASGDFTPAGTSPEPAGDEPRSLVAANLGGSASTDLAVANASSDNVSILFGTGNSNFTAAGTSPEQVGDEPFSIVAGVFGGGPGLDLATANPEGGNVTILLNDAPRASVKCGGKTATRVGTNGANVIRGTKGRDVIAGLGGKDKIRGRGGKDILCGGGGRDRLIGGGGRDRLLGQAGRDVCIGGPKRDVARKCEVRRSI